MSSEIKKCKSMKKEKVYNIVKIVMTILSIIIIIIKVDLGELVYSIRDCSFLHFGLAFIIAVFANLVGAISLNAIYSKEKVLDIFIVTLKSNFFSMILPGQLLGETTKIFLLSKERSSIAERMSAVLIDKFLNVIAMLLVGGIGIFISPNINNLNLQKGIVIGFIILVICLFLIKNKKIMNLLLSSVSQIKLNGRIKDKLEEYLSIWIEYSCNNKNIIKSGIWGIVYQMVIVSEYYVLSLGVGIEISYWDYCWVNAILTIILFLPISVGGLGIREVSLIGFLGLLNVSSEKAVSLSVLLLAIQVIRAFGGGILLLVGRRMKKNEENINTKL